MTKSNRHKKFRKQEKAKTQLTGVRKLSKAQNVVEPILRVKKILIRDQLKTSLIPVDGIGQISSHLRSTSSHGSTLENDDDVTTRRKQNIQELLSSANHHNSHMKKDAILGLQEIASLQIKSVIRNLDKILPKIASLTSDQDGEVRKENLKLAEAVFSKVSENQLRPFWSMLIAHLKCTLTHLISSVRYSALAFINLLIEYYPTLVTEANSIILPSLLSLISNNQNTSNEKKTKVNKPSSAKLKVEISGKHSDMKERLKVFNLLTKCIRKAQCDSQIIRMENHVLQKDPCEYLCLTYPFGYCWDQTQENELFNSLGFGPCATAPRAYSVIAADPFSSVFSSDLNQKTSSFWPDFVSWCISVLVETWIEISPSVPEGHTSGQKRGKSIDRPRFVNINITGSDKDAANASRQNGLHILNENTVDNLLCIVTLFEQLLMGSSVNPKTGSFDNKVLEEQSVKAIRKLQGQNIMKYFFHLMPYVALQDSRRKVVTGINLKLFLISGRLRMLDGSMKKKLQTFIKGTMERQTVEKDQCRGILNIIGYATDQDFKSLSTSFLAFSSKIGFWDVVAAHLVELLHPSKEVLNESSKELLGSLQWTKVLPVLIESWPVSDSNVKNLLEVLTFVSLRRLTDMHSLLVENIGKLKELVGGSKRQDVKEAAHRTFVYADADDIFQTEFAKILPVIPVT